MTQMPFTTESPSLIRHLLDPDEIDDVVAAADSLVEAQLRDVFKTQPEPTVITRQDALMAVLIAQLANVHAQLYEIREVLQNKAVN